MTPPGTAAAIAAMRTHWRTLPECSVYAAAGLDCLAVPLSLACELWGYGQAMPPVLALTLPASFTPAPGWRLDAAQGYMAFDGTDAGRLVLLRDLVQWRIQSKPCPPRVAVEDVIADLSATWATQWLYQVTPGDYACPLRAGDCFSDVRGFWEQFAEDDAEKRRGLLGLLYAMREHWGADGLPDADQVQRKGLQALERVAIRMDVAHALWGWGTIAAPVVLSLVPSEARVATVPASAGKVPMKALHPEWTGEALQKKRATLTGHDTTRQLAEITGLPPREITRREKQSRDDAEQARQAGKRPLGGAA